MHFCWGIASSMVFSLLPIFIIDELGGSSKSFGALEGSVIFLSFMAKLFAGFIMDIFKKKLPMLKMGSILTILSKFLLACAPSIFFVFISKSIDRFAKGLRQAPSDAILAELSSKKGLAYSLRYTTNIAGFLIGSIITSAMISMLGQNFRLIFSLAILPTIVAIYILKTKVQRFDEDEYKQTTNQRWKISDISLMPKAYWKFLIFITLLMFNRFSEGFITIRAKDVLPNSLGDIPLFTAIYELFAMFIALFVGTISDKFDQRKLILVGIFILMIADSFAIFANSFSTIILCYIFAGVHIGATQGVIGSMIAKTAPKNLIGTAFALFYGVEGIVLLLANNLAGYSSEIAKLIGLQQSSMPFVFGFIFSLMSAFYIFSWLNNKNFSLI